MILFVSNSPFLGGAEYYLLDIIQSLKNDFVVKVAVPPGLVEQEVKKLKVETVELSIGSTLGRFRGLNLINFQNIFRTTSLRGLLQDLLEENSEVLVHTQDYKEMVLFTLAAKNLPVKLVYVQHTILPGWLKKNPLVIKFLVSIWNSQDKIVAVSDAVKNELISFGVKEEKVLRVYNGIDVSLFKPFSPKEKLDLKKKYSLENKKVVGINGRIAWGKGQDVVLLALNELLKKFPDAYVLLIGTGSKLRQRKLDKIVEKFSLQEHVTFFGSWPREKIPEFYALLDVFTLPSLSEGLPLSIMEAMACEVPCVGTSVAGIPEEIVHKKTGFVMNGKTPEELTSLVSKIFTDKKLQQNFGQEGRKVVEKNFDKKLMVKNMKELYMEVAKR